MMNLQNDAVLELREVSYRYPGGAVGLNACSAAIPRGSRTIVLGPNGAGKTTFFMHLNGLLRPQSGQVFYKKNVLDYGRSGLRALRTGIGMVFQNPDAQLFSASVREDISFGPVNLGLDKKTVSSRVDEALAMIGITDIADKPVHALSHGQKKRVCIAGVLAMQPEVIVLDEPTMGLDKKSELALFSILKRLHSQGITIIMATHDVDLAYGWADNAILLERGGVAARCGSADFEKEFLQLARAGIGMPKVADLFGTLERGGIVAPGTQPPRTKEEFQHLLEKCLESLNTASVDGKNR